jgi:hypothetical protein
LLAAGPSAAEEAIRSPSLRVASWNVSEATQLMAPRRTELARPSWRTTFGSERHTERTQAVEATTLDADAVLLQGVTDVPLLRRLFPARDWRLVVSRQLLLAGNRIDGSPADAAAVQPVTAVAVRNRKGLRITGREHLLDLGVPAADTAGPAPAAPTAVRISDGGHEVWVVSVALPEPCSAGAVDCAPRDRLATWHESKRETGQAIVTGGRFQNGRTPALPAPACSHQAIETDLQHTDTQSPRSEGVERQGMGCVASIELAP